MIGRTDGRQMVVVVMGCGGGCGGRRCRWMHHGRRHHAAGTGTAAGTAAAGTVAGDLVLAGRRRRRLAGRRVGQRPDFGLGRRRRGGRGELLLVLLVHVHHAVLMGSGIAGHLLGVVVVGVVHQVGDGHGDGHVASTAVVVVLVMRRVDQVVVVVVVRMDQMVQRIAADGMRRNGAPRVVVAVAFVIAVICAREIQKIKNFC